MKKQNLTGWYQPHQKPVRVGWYDTILCEGETCNQWHWDGIAWGDNNGYICNYQDRFWRGGGEMTDQEMTDQEINIALAEAIGWERAKEFSWGVMVSSDGLNWRLFDYRNPAVIWPIATKYDAFPMRSCEPGLWHAPYMGDDTHPSYGATPELAVAMAVINGVKKC